MVSYTGEVVDSFGYGQRRWGKEVMMGQRDLLEPLL